MDTRPVGVFDSGFGGLTLLDECISQLPNEQFVYFGDTLRVPYGTKAPDEVMDYSLETLRWFEKRDVKTIVIGCNTTSSIALPLLNTMTEIPVFGMIDAGVSTVMTWLELTGIEINRLGIIGTKNTITSRIHENRLRTEGFLGEIYPTTCSLFSMLFIEGIMDKSIWLATINYYLSNMRDVGVDGLLLGATSYPLASEYLQEYFGGGVQIFDPNFMMAKQLKEYLDLNDLSNPRENTNKADLFVTGSLDAFVNYYKRFFQFDYEKLESVVLSDLAIQ
ncbi:MAG: glutamate racemase [bacterium]|nr:glutamate racemase [bacterium]